MPVLGDPLMPVMDDGTILRVDDLSVSFRTDEGPITPVMDVAFSVARGRTLGLVGESGSGKSVSSKALMRLLPGSATLGAASRIRYRAKSGELIEIEKLRLRDDRLRHLRGGEIGMIFQEPMASFSPVYTIGNQMIEAIRLHRGIDKRAARDLAVAMLAKVGISSPESRIDQYPHALSGGMRQRAMIALALSAGPQLLIADEPTTALDVTIQAQVLKLMRDLQDELGMGVIFITHDLGVIAQVADDVAVMYLGTIVERGPAKAVIREPKHPYTKGLLAAIPTLETLEARLKPVPGDIPSPAARPRGCPFHTRCAEAIKGLCDTVAPGETDLGADRKVHCHLHAESGCSAA